MSYRVWVNHHQLFGNNESYPEWEEWVKSQGIEIGPDGNYNFYTKDFNGMMQAVEKIVKRLIKERHEDVIKGRKYFNFRLNKEVPYKELGDYSNILEEVEKKQKFYNNKNLSLHFYLRDHIENGYFFLTYRLFDICRDKLEDHLVSYKVTDPKGIEISAG